MGTSPVLCWQNGKTEQGASSAEARFCASHSGRRTAKGTYRHPCSTARQSTYMRQLSRLLLVIRILGLLCCLRCRSGPDWSFIHGPCNTCPFRDLLCLILGSPGSEAWPYEFGRFFLLPLRAHAPVPGAASLAQHGSTHSTTHYALVHASMAPSSQPPLRSPGQPWQSSHRNMRLGMVQTMIPSRRNMDGGRRGNGFQMAWSGVNCRITRRKAVAGKLWKLQDTPRLTEHMAVHRIDGCRCWAFERTG